MLPWILVGIAILIIIFFMFGLPFICFIKIFYSSPKSRIKKDGEYSLQQADIYKPYHKIMIDFIDRVNALPHKNVSVKSFDGLTLRGRYFEYKPDAPIEIIFHGYRGDSESDLSGGVFRCFALERNVLLVDQRAGGKSDGKVISFGVNECKDCLPWVNYVIENINKDAVIFLCGVSMGAATVMMASEQNLPKNVVAVMADCGYTSAKDIIKKVIKDMKLPPNLLYPFAKLGAKMFGKFNLDENSPIKALKNSKLPVFFLHGDNDLYVPYEMSVKNFEACNSPKYLATIEGAGHGLAYIVNPEKYINEMKTFADNFVFNKWL